MRCEREVVAASGRWGAPQGCAHVKSGFDFPILQYIDKHGQDLPEIQNWKWSNPK
jgi:hypothetical protein